MQEPIVDTYLEKIEEKANGVLLSMDAFHKQWEHLIYEDYTLNKFQVFGEQGTLHISIYNDWKYKSDTILNILQNLESISDELEIATALKAFDKNVIEKINLGTIKLLKAVESFEVDRYATEQLVAQCKEEICTKIQTRTQKEKSSTAQKEKPLTVQKEKPSTAQKEKSSTAQKEESSTAQKENPKVAKPNNTFDFSSFVKKGVDSICNMVSLVPGPTNTKTTKDPKNRQKNVEDLAQALTKFSTLAITMNTDLKSFGLIISATVQNIKINNNEATDLSEKNGTVVPVLALEKIIHKLQYLFESMQHEAFKNVEITQVLVLETNPRYLLSQ